MKSCLCRRSVSTNRISIDMGLFLCQNHLMKLDRVEDYKVPERDDPPMEALPKEESNRRALVDRLKRREKRREKRKKKQTL